MAEREEKRGKKCKEKGRPLLYFSALLCWEDAYRLEESQRREKNTVLCCSRKVSPHVTMRPTEKNGRATRGVRGACPSCLDVIFSDASNRGKYSRVTGG